MNIWDYWSVRYEKLLVQKYSLQPTRIAVMNTVANVGKQGAKILDIGCGTGQLSVMVDNKNYIGIDTSKGMIEMTKDKPGKFYNTTIYDYNGGGFDIAVCTHTFPYVENPKKFLVEINKKLKDDGILILANASINNWYDRFCMFFIGLTTSKCNYWSVAETNSFLVDAGFKDIECSFIGKKKYLFPQYIIWW